MVRRYDILIAAFAACAWPGTGPQGRPQPPLAFAITDVTLIDGTGAQPLPHVTVVVESGRIARIQPAAEPLPANVRAVRGAGRFLIPGLWDMHAHLTSAGDVACPVMVASGVTGVRDPGGELEVVDWLRARIAGGELVGPRIFRAGPFVDGDKPGVADRLVVRTAEDGRRAVTFLRRRGVDFIKVHNGTPPAAYFALLAEARRQGVQVVGHIPLAVDPARAIEAGHGSVEHVVSLFEGRVARKVESGKSQEQALAEFTDADVAALGRQMAAQGTWFDPTLITYWMRTSRRNVPAESDPRHRHVSASLAAFWSGARLLPDTPEVRDLLARGWRRFVEIAVLLRRERVRFLAGTDLGAPNIYPGFSLHDELELLVEVGFTPLEVISIATRNAAESLGRLGDLGTVEPGKRADLVLLEADPIADIASTRKIAAVVVDGRLHGRAELDAMLERSASLARTR